MSLKHKTIIGILWNTFELLGGRVVQLMITIILARILIPEDFGVIALLIVFTELSKVISDSGFSQALIRKKVTTDKDYTAVFYFNIIVSSCLYIILYYSAPHISNFYNYPELTNISKVIFLTIVINSFALVPDAIARRAVNFKILAQRTLIANFIAGIIAVYLAYAGFGVWSLVLQMLIASILRVILLWVSTTWRPSLTIDFYPIKSMFAFSGNLLLSGIIDSIVANIQTLLIGKFYTNADVGFYSQANLLATVPSQTLTLVVKNVTYPILSTVDNDKYMKSAYRKIISIAVFIVFPMMLGLMAIAEHLIPLLLGDKWIPAVNYFMLLCLMGAIFPLYMISQNIFLARGNSKLYLKISIVQRFITLLGLLITIKYSVLALVIGQVVTTAINTILTMYYSGKEINYNFLEQLKDISGIILASVSMFAIIYTLGYNLNIDNPLLIMFIQTIVGLLVYFALAFIFKLTILTEFKSIINNLKNKVK